MCVQKISSTSSRQKKINNLSWKKVVPHDFSWLLSEKNNYKACPKKSLFIHKSSHKTMNQNRKWSPKIWTLTSKSSYIFYVYTSCSIWYKCKYIQTISSQLSAVQSAFICFCCVYMQVTVKRVKLNHIDVLEYFLSLYAFVEKDAFFL